MSRARFIPLLAFVLIVSALDAQSGSAQARSNRNAGAGAGRAVGRGENTHTQRSHRDLPVGTGFIDPFWYGGYYDEPAVIEREVPVPVVAPPPQIEPERIPSAPKMTEIPSTRKAENASRMPAAIFVLASGERIESRQYLLTANSVQLTVERKRRSIPLEALDLRATLAANRERGLDLQIPAGGSEIVLGF